MIGIPLGRMPNGTTLPMERLMSKPLSVTYEFTVEFTDFVEFDWPLMTREQARETLWQALYRADKHAAFSLDIKDDE